MRKLKWREAVTDPVLLDGRPAAVHPRSEREQRRNERLVVCGAMPMPDAPVHPWHKGRTNPAEMGKRARRRAGR
jgi:hypothetical protein